MGNELHITNGDSTVDLLRSAGFAGEILPWRDILHDGPVPTGLALESLSQLRADFIAARGWADAEDVRSDFAQRDRQLGQFTQFQRVRLWFEHDLYDQLQILQILDYLAGRDWQITRVSMICTEQYLGLATPERLLTLQRFELPVSENQLAVAKQAWKAFGAATPHAWHRLTQLDTSALPFLHDAVMRQLREYPDSTTGLSLTETRALEALAREPQSAARLFGHNQQQESRIYLGDWSYWIVLTELMSAPEPLISSIEGAAGVTPASAQQGLEITDYGRDVLSGRQCRIDTGFPDRWIGGVQLRRPALWCWNEKQQSPELDCADGFRLRRAATADAADISACVSSAYQHYVERMGKPPGPMLDDYAQVVQEHEAHVVISQSNELVAALVLIERPEGLLIDNVAVRPDAQGAGLGKRLMWLAEQRGRELGYNEIELYTHELMTENQHIYQKLGYSETRRIEEKGYERVYMSKLLS